MWSFSWETCPCSHSWRLIPLTLSYLGWSLSALREKGQKWILVLQVLNPSFMAEFCVPVRLWLKAYIFKPPVHTWKVQCGAHLEACLALKLVSLTPNLMNTFCELTGSRKPCLCCMKAFEGYLLCYLLLYNLYIYFSSTYTKILLHNPFKTYCFLWFCGFAGRFFYWPCLATFVLL